MKQYAIYDEDLDRKTAIGYLFYYEKADAFIIELCDDLDEWEAPLLFRRLVKNGIYTISKEFSLLWVKERVIPSERQNIGMILRNARLKAYSEMAFLLLSKGRCAQDNCYIKEISEGELPGEIKKRFSSNIEECFVSENKQIICLFQDNTVRKIDLAELLNKKQSSAKTKKNKKTEEQTETELDRNISYILKNDDLLYSVKVGVGGYSITFNDSIEIPVTLLREKGTLLPLNANDFKCYAQSNIVDTTKASDIMNCSRQNISYLVKTGQLEPVICGTKENLYTKGAIEKIKND